MSRFHRAPLLWIKCFVKLSNNVRAEVASTVELGCIIYKAPSHQLTSALNLFLFIILWIKTQRPPNDVLICACWSCNIPLGKDCFACNCPLFQIVILLNRRRRTFWIRNTCSALLLLVWLSCASPPLAGWREGLKKGTNLIIYRQLWGNRSVWSEAIR